MFAISRESRSKRPLGVILVKLKNYPGVGMDVVIILKKNVEVLNEQERNKAIVKVHN